jgi:hypothetical protein
MTACCAALSGPAPRVVQHAQLALAEQEDAARFRGIDAASLPGIDAARLPRGDTARFPCAAGQAALWLAEQCGEAIGVYNTAVVLHLTGGLQVPVLARALELLFARHELLRATLHFNSRDRRVFATIGDPPQISLEPVTLPPEGLRGYLHALAARPFDLEAGPLWRIELVTTGSRAWCLLLCIHHCVTDGWSGGVLLRHLAEAYNALLLDAQWTAVAQDCEFRNICQRQQPVAQDELQWWRTRLDSADRLRNWPFASVRVQRWPFALSCIEQTLDEPLLAEVHATRRSVQVEFSACLLAALRLALRALTGVDELCIGMPVSLRDASAQEEAVGYFVNLVVLRERVAAGTDNIAVLQQVQRNLAETLCHRAAPLPELARVLRPRQTPFGNPWCDILFAYQNLRWDVPGFVGLQAGVEALTLAGQYPLKVEFIPEGATCRCRIEYAHELIPGRQVHALHAAIRAQLAGFVATRSS